MQAYKFYTLKFVVLVVLILVGSLTKLSCQTTSADKLKVEFMNPPGEARPWAFWFWINGN